ncbi:MAG: hypothetical protein QXL86_03240 [Candidatus Aenigmatarchaeota archaeon]
MVRILSQNEFKNEFLVSVLKREKEEIERKFYRPFNIFYCSWKDIDKSHVDFLKALDKGDINKAKNFITKKKIQLKFFSEKLRELYDIIENTEIKESEIPEIKDEMEIMKIWSYKEKRKRQIRNACRRIGEYIDYVEKLEKELDLNDKDNLLKFGTLLHLFNDRASNVFTMVDATISKTVRILDLSTDEKEYSRLVNENKRKIVSTLARYVRSLEMSKYFSNITLPTGEKVGIHGEYDKDYIGESDLMMGLNEVLNPTLTLIDCDEKDFEIIKNKIEEAARDWKLDDETKKRIFDKFNKIKDLVWDLYGMSGIENICVEVEKIKVVTEDRVYILKELYQKGKCRAIPEFQITHTIEPHTLEIVDVLIRFMNEKFGKKTSLISEIKEEEESYINNFSREVVHIAKYISDFVEHVNKIKEKNTVNYHDLLNTYTQLENKIKSLFSPKGIMLIEEPNKPNYLLRKELSSNLKGMWDWIQKYRITSQYSSEIGSYIDNLINYTERAIQKLNELRKNSEKKVSENPLVV